MLKIKGALDAGHGGNDRANKGISGEYIEADGNLEFVLYMKERFDKVKDLFDITLTRSADKSMSLTSRGKMAKGKDFFISIHSDAYNSKAFGVKIFDSVDLKNEEFAKKVANAYAKVIGSVSRGCYERESNKYVGEDYYTVIDSAQDIGCPNVLLLERDFHSNPEIEKKLLDSDLMKKGAYAVVDEYIKYYFPNFDFNTIDNPTQPKTQSAKLGLITNVKSTANVRVAPNHNSPIQSTINLGAEVLLRYECDGTYVDNNNGKWWKIRYNKNGKWYDGYISASKINEIQ